MIPPKFGSVQYVAQQVDYGVARGYVFARVDAGDYRLSLADARRFAEQFAADGGSWGNLRAQYEKFAADTAAAKAAREDVVEAVIYCGKPVEDSECPLVDGHNGDCVNEVPF